MRSCMCYKALGAVPGKYVIHYMFEIIIILLLVCHPLLKYCSLFEAKDHAVLFLFIFCLA